jgi:hypothetical protein
MKTTHRLKGTPEERQAEYDALSRRLSKDPNYRGFRDFDNNGVMIAFMGKKGEFQDKPAEKSS